MEFVDPFSDRNGKVLAYTIIVAYTNKSVLDNPVPMPSWSSARKDPRIMAYQAFPECADFFNSPNTCSDGQSRRKKRATGDRVQHIIGGENCKIVDDAYTYCNGPLEPGKTHFVLLRGITENGHEDSAFSDPTMTGECNFLLTISTLSKMAT